MKHKSRMRENMTGSAAELYDYVSSRYPRFEDKFIQRRGSSVDDAFRHLLRAVIDDTAKPQGWMCQRWPDVEVIRVAQDPEIRRRAWVLLVDESPDGWRQLWVRRNVQDRRFSYGLSVVGALVILGVILWNVLV